MGTHLPEAQGKHGDGDLDSSCRSTGSTASEPVVNLDEAQQPKYLARYSSGRLLEQEYQIDGKVIGSGMTGPVRLAVGRSDGRPYAVKSFTKPSLSPQARADLRNEVELYLTLDHPHIAQLQRVFESHDGLHLVMEYMEGGELYHRLAEAKKYTEERAADTVYQMLLAIAYLHSHSIAHRDVKLENFLYERKDTDHLKLIDFGLSKFWDASTIMSQACGSLHYVAPEVLGHSYTVQADLWSVGVISYMLLTGTPVFLGEEHTIIEKIKAAKPNYSMRFRSLSQPAQDFVRCLLEKDPSRRLTAVQALDHPWIQGRQHAADVQISPEILTSLRTYSQSSAARKMLLSMMAWSLTVDEQEELRKQFLLLDSDETGVINMQDFKSTLAKNFELDDPELEQLFSALDTEHTQEIHYSQFLAAALTGRIKTHEDILRRTFQRFDLSGSGSISTEDLQQALGDGFEKNDVEELMSEVGTPTSAGQLDYEHFLAYFYRSQPGTPTKARDSKLTKMLDMMSQAETDSPTDEGLPKSASFRESYPHTPNKRLRRVKTMPASRFIMEETQTVLV